MNGALGRFDVHGLSALKKYDVKMIGPNLTTTMAKYGQNFK